MLEFDDSPFLFLEADSTMNLTTGIFLLSAWLFHVEIPSLIFGIPDDSPVKFVNWDLSVLFFEIPDKPPCYVQQCCMLLKIV